MPVVQQTTPDSTEQDEAARDLSARIEELQAEIDALRRENASLNQADAERKQAEEERERLLNEVCDARRRVGADLDAMTKLQQLGTLFMRGENLESVLAEIVDTAITICGADFGNIQLLDLESRNLTIVAQRGFPQWWLDFWNTVCMDKGSCGTALEHGERVIVEDVEQSPIFIGTPALDIQLRAGVRAVQSTPIISRSGKPLGMFSTHYTAPHRPEERELRLLDILARQAGDILERARSEEALRESEVSYRTIVETINEGIWEQDKQHNTLHVNPAMAAMLGYRIDEMIGRPVPEFLFEDIPTLHAACQAQRHNGFHGKYECRLKHRDGTARWVLVSATPKRNPDGTYAGSIGVFTDITERKRAEEALKESQQKYQALFNNKTVGLSHCQSIFDDNHQPVDYIVLDINATYEELVGITREQIVGKRITEAFPGVSQDLIDRHNRVAVTGQESHFKICVSTINKWFDVNVMSPQKGQFVAIFYNVTERKRAEEALRQYIEDLARLQSKLEVSNREANLYLDILTHDIGNTENVSNLYADLLLDAFQGEKEAIEYVHKLQRSVKKSIEILSTVSTIRRIHRTDLRLRPVDLDAVIREVLRQFPDITAFYDGTNYQVLADDLLSVIFNNLIGNAVKHGDADVAISIRVEEQNDKVLVSVEDTGPGVPDDQKTEIFHRYEQQKRGVGEGLGLYLVQILVERYGGKVWVEDRVAGHPEEGAAFRFTLQKAE